MKLLLKVPVLVLMFVTLVCCGAKENQSAIKHNIDPELAARLDTAVFAGGCFWCIEAIFERVKGVEDVVSGYSGGTKKNPTYEEVGAGLTNYAESVRILFDPKVISYEELVEILLESIDPTQLNRQGPDVGKQYRSAVFYKNEAQKQAAEKVKAKLDDSGMFNGPIVTEITPFISFYEAEDYHQNYYELHPNQPYVATVSRPKVEKFMKKFKDKLKDEYKK